MIKRKKFSVSDLSNAHHQVPLFKVNQKSPAFVIGNKKCKFCHSFYGPCGLAINLRRLMALSMAPLIKANEEFTYFDDTILQVQKKLKRSELF